jgi:hypothetical protein
MATRHDYIVTYRQGTVYTHDRVGDAEIGVVFQALQRQGAVLLSCRTVCSYAGTRHPEARLTQAPCACLEALWVREHEEVRGAPLLSSRVLDAAMNPYYRPPAEHHAAKAQLQAAGYRLRTELLYDPRDGRVAGTRVGLFDDTGCLEERFYRCDGWRADAALQTVVDLHRRVPRPWKQRPETEPA